MGGSPRVLRVLVVVGDCLLTCMIICKRPGCHSWQVQIKFSESVASAESGRQKLVMTLPTKWTGGKAKAFLESTFPGVSVHQVYVDVPAKPTYYFTTARVVLDASMGSALVKQFQDDMLAYKAPAPDNAAWPGLLSSLQDCGIRNVRYEKAAWVGGAGAASAARPRIIVSFDGNKASLKVAKRFLNDVITTVVVHRVDVPPEKCTPALLHAVDNLKARLTKVHLQGGDSASGHGGGGGGAGAGAGAGAGGGAGAAPASASGAGGAADSDGTASHGGGASAPSVKFSRPTIILSVATNVELTSAAAKFCHVSVIALKRNEEEAAVWKQHLEDLIAAFTSRGFRLPPGCPMLPLKKVSADFGVECDFDRGASVITVSGPRTAVNDAIQFLDRLAKGSKVSAVGFKFPPPDRTTLA